MFFDWLMVVLVVGAYFAVFWKTVKRFAKKVNEKLRRKNAGRLKALLFLIAVLVGYAIAPVVWIAYTLSDRKREKDRWEAEDRERKDRVYRAELRAEHARQRKEWFERNPPQLYYNTIAGITAVLRPAEFKLAERDTRYAIADGRWGKVDVFCSQNRTFLFATTEGRKTLEATLGYKFFSGWWSVLLSLSEEHGVKLLRDNRIFVPGVNEALVSFEEQRRVLSTSDDHLEVLVYRQAPDLVI